MEIETQNKIDVLDHGYVRLIDHMGNDLSVVRAARVSYDAAWRAGENDKSDERLINYLWKNRHTTPFEAVTFTFEVMAPIFVFRQWHRHRTWSFNELSARYKELPEVYYVPEAQYMGRQSQQNKQGRIIDVYEGGTHNQNDAWAEIMNRQCAGAFITYRRLIAEGVPREVARIVLPLATYTHMFATVNLLNLFKFLTLRSHEHAQYEIRVYAEAMKKLITPIVPVCVSAFDNNT